MNAERYQSILDDPNASKQSKIWAVRDLVRDNPAAALPSAESLAEQGYPDAAAEALHDAAQTLRDPALLLPAWNYAASSKDAYLQSRIGRDAIRELERSDLSAALKIAREWRTADSGFRSDPARELLKRHEQPEPTAPGPVATPEPPPKPPAPKPVAKKQPEPEPASSYEETMDALREVPSRPTMDTLNAILSGREAFEMAMEASQLEAVVGKAPKIGNDTPINVVSTPKKAKPGDLMRDPRAWWASDVATSRHIPRRPFYKDTGLPYRLVGLAGLFMLPACNLADASLVPGFLMMFFGFNFQKRATKREQAVYDGSVKKGYFLFPDSLAIAKDELTVIPKSELQLRETAYGSILMGQHDQPICMNGPKFTKVLRRWLRP